MGPPGPALYLDGGVVSLGARWVRINGFTTAVYNGNLGGIVGANQKCEAEYPGSTFCSLSDFRTAEPDTSNAPPTGSAWIDGPRDAEEERAGTGCSTWTSASNSTTAGYVDTAGSYNASYCNVARPLTCCTIPLKRTFRGITAFTSNGNLGGVMGANSRCRAEFPGSFFCTLTDFKAAEVRTPPGGGPWVDGPRDENDRRAGTGCSTWTSASGSTTAGYLEPTGGYAASYCSVARPIACCQ